MHMYRDLFNPGIAVLVQTYDTLVKTPCQVQVDAPRVGSWSIHKYPRIAPIDSILGLRGQPKHLATSTVKGTLEDIV